MGVLGQSTSGTAVHGFSSSGRAVVAQSATGAALRLFPQAAPGSAAAGDIYFDNGGNLNVFSGGTWKRVQFAP